MKELEKSSGGCSIQGGKSGNPPGEEPHPWTATVNLPERGRAAKKKHPCSRAGGCRGTAGISQFPSGPRGPGSHSNSGLRQLEYLSPLGTSSSASTISGRLSPIMWWATWEAGRALNGVPAVRRKALLLCPVCPRSVTPRTWRTFWIISTSSASPASLTVSHPVLTGHHDARRPATPCCEHQSQFTQPQLPKVHVRPVQHRPPAPDAHADAAGQQIGSYGGMSQYCAPGLLKELLTSDSPPQ